jgi:hypothetical protein
LLEKFVEVKSPKVNGNNGNIAGAEEEEQVLRSCAVVAV